MDRTVSARRLHRSVTRLASGRLVPSAVLLAALAASPAAAHVALDAPNGGEQLAVGSVFTIQWHDVINHGPANYDLWYSITGPAGPWLEIVADLDPAQSDYQYDWTVPDTPSETVRVRVRQDNQAMDYQDISDADLAIVAAAGDAPVAAFGYAPTSPRVGEEVQFTDTSSGGPTEWAWEFGDGETASLQSPSHSYAEAGTYTVTLTAGNDAGSDSHSVQLTVTSDTPDLTEMVLLPAAANAAGAAGSFFATAIDIYNHGTTPATCRVLWLPRGADNSSPTATADFTLAAGQTLHFGNLLADLFGAEDAVGAAAILSDSDQLEIMSRTFNQSDAGTFGQSLPGVGAGDLIPAGERVRILFLTEGHGYRSNLGLASGVTFPITVEVELFAADGSSLGTRTVELPPLGNLQLNRVLRDVAPIEAAHAEVWTDTAGGLFSCYGSVLDEVTSDPTTVLPSR